MGTRSSSVGKHRRTQCAQLNTSKRPHPRENKQFQRSLKHKATPRNITRNAGNSLGETTRKAILKHANISRTIQWRDPIKQWPQPVGCDPSWGLLSTVLENRAIPIKIGNHCYKVCDYEETGMSQWLPSLLIIIRLRLLQKCLECIQQWK